MYLKSVAKSRLKEVYSLYYSKISYFYWRDDEVNKETSQSKYKAIKVLAVAAIIGGILAPNGFSLVTER